jgi:Transglutaminase-like superfamily
MTGSVLAEVEIGARAIATRLRLASLVRRRSLPELLLALTPGATTAPLPLPAAERAIAAAERVVERLRVVPDTCLYRSLARYQALRRAGHPARFVLALDPRAADIEGHAWVELDGEPVGETLDPGLTVTFAYPQP